MAFLLLSLITVGSLFVVGFIGVVTDFIPMSESREVARMEANAETAKHAVEEITLQAQAEILSLLAEARQRNGGAW